MRQIALLSTLLLAGCHGYLVPFDDRPLPAPGPAELRGGARLDVGPTGDLVLRPPAGDVEASLGVALVELEGGLAVTHRLRPDADLRPGDRIVHAAALMPGGGATILSLHAAMLERAAAAASGETAGGPARGWRDPPGTTLAPRPQDELDSFDPALAVLMGEQGAAFAWLDADRPRAARGGRVVLVHGDVAMPVATDALGLPRGDVTVAPVSSASTASEVRARPGNHPVRRLDDLRGYLVAAAWVELDLVVVPEGGEDEMVVRVRLRDEAGWVPVRTWRPELTRRHGVDLARVDDWPPERRPVHAEDDDLLVVRVARDAPAGRAGLRPLDAVPQDALAALLAAPGDAAAGAPLRVRRPDGTTRHIVLEPREAPTQVEVPPFVTWEDDGARGHVGVGLFDFLYHASWHADYSPTTDTYERTWRWSVLTFFQGAGLDGPGGARETGGVNVFSLDGARMAYWAEWRAIEDEAARRRGGAP